MGWRPPLHLASGPGLNEHGWRRENLRTLPRPPDPFPHMSRLLRDLETFRPAYFRPAYYASRTASRCTADFDADELVDWERVLDRLVYADEAHSLQPLLSLLLF